MLPSESIYFIGETAFHHQGEKQYLLELIETAAEVGASAIKFHLLFNPEDYFIKSHPALEIIKKWTFTPKEWQEIFNFAKEKDLDIIALCNDVESLNWILNICTTQPKAIEIHATGINDVFLLESASKFRGTVVLGIGGSTLDEIDFAIKFLKSKGQEDLFLMYGFQNYPTDYKDINFEKIKVIENLFGLPVGYADHTDPQDNNNAEITAAVVFKGVNVIEKHFTLTPDDKRIDSQAAVSKEKFRNALKLADLFSQVNGKGGLAMSDAEKKYGDTGPMKKALVARGEIPKGKIIGIEDISYKRTPQSSYLSQRDFSKLVGSKALRSIHQDEHFTYENVEYKFDIAEVQQFLNDK